VPAPGHNSILFDPARLSLLVRFSDSGVLIMDEGFAVQAVILAYFFL
jgi:hypothetical protein